MTLLNPHALFWGLLGVPIVVLYLRAMPRRRYTVATSFLWQQVFPTSRARTAWQRWRRPVSLAVQLSILGLMVTALAEPSQLDVRDYLVTAALVALVVEWGLNQRRWTC